MSPNKMFLPKKLQGNFALNTDKYHILFLQSNRITKFIVHNMKMYDPTDDMANLHSRKMYQNRTLSVFNTNFLCFFFSSKDL